MLNLDCENMVTKMNMKQMKESARKLKEAGYEKLYGVLCITTDEEASTGVWKIYPNRELAENWFDEAASYFESLYDTLMCIREESRKGKRKIVETFSYVHDGENESTVMTMYEL